MKWEYWDFSVAHGSNHSVALKNAGDVGWELVSVETGNMVRRFWFKRPLSEPQEVRDHSGNLLGHTAEKEPPDYHPCGSRCGQMGGW